MLAHIHPRRAAPARASQCPLRANWTPPVQSNGAQILMGDFQIPPAVLAVCLPALAEDDAGDGISLCHAGSGREALELLRVLRFDLVLVGRDLPDGPLWCFVREVQSVWPWQRWALVAPRLSEREEREARMLGVAQIVEAVPEGPDLRAMGCAAGGRGQR